MASGFGPYDLKTATGRLIFKDYLHGDRKHLQPWRFAYETLFCLHVKFRCGNYHNILSLSHWRCYCDD